MPRILEILLIFALITGMTACASVKKKGEAGEEGAAATESSMEAADAAEEKALQTRVIYFDFDSSVIKPEFEDVLKAHAEYIAGHPGISVVLEGHADERGTREYNIALGERRAKAVRQVLTLQGVPQKQLQVISFGEERPVALGHDESAWALNRRVELLYSGE